MILSFERKTFLNVMLAVVVTVTLATAPEMAHASSGAGQSLLQDITGLLTGSMGTVIGLGISLFGLWVWLAQQSSWGLLIVIAGAAITAFPGLYKGMTQGFKAAFAGSGAQGTSAQ